VLGGWQFEWSVMTSLLVAGTLYAVGARRSRLRRTGPAVIRILAFYAGLLAVVVALESPIDRLAGRYFWVHMLQHELLLMVGPPLVLLGKPFLVMWRAVPLARRRQVARKLVKSAGWHAVWRSTASGRTPRAAWSMFMANFVLWHLPYAYDLTLQHPGIHMLEHALFFLTAINFWARVIPSRPIHRLRERSDLVAYLAGAALVDNVFDTVFVAAPHSLYSHYADLARAPGALSALTDQSIAGGVMNLIGSLALYGALIILLRQPERRSAQRTSPVTSSA
jgi:putative membrane protein